MVLLISLLMVVCISSPECCGRTDSWNQRNSPDAFPTDTNRHRAGRRRGFYTRIGWRIFYLEHFGHEFLLSAFLPLKSNWLQGFTHKAQEVLSQQNKESSSALPVIFFFFYTNTWCFDTTWQNFWICLFSLLLFQELLEKLKEAEESHGTLQAECEQYRTVLAETVSDRNRGAFSWDLNANFANMEIDSTTNLILFLYFFRKEC